MFPILMCVCLDPLFTRRAVLTFEVPMVSYTYEIPFFDIIYDFLLWYSIEYQYNFRKFRYSNGWFVGKWQKCNMHVFLADVSCVNVNVVVPNIELSNAIHRIRIISILIIYRSKMSSELPIIVVCSEGAKTSQEIITSEKIFDYEWH